MIVANTSKTRVLVVLMLAGCGSGRAATPASGVAGSTGTGGTTGIGAAGGMDGRGSVGGAPVNGVGGDGAGADRAGGRSGGGGEGLGVGGMSGIGGAPSSIPSNPIPFKTNDPFTLDSVSGGITTTNYVFVPAAYDSTHATPIGLLVWLHGCGGMSSGDVWTVSPGGSTQTWITLAVGGREGDCWDVDDDRARVLAAIANIKTHFNVAPKRVILGGYSSGGDLTYRLAFYNAEHFAGVLVENSSPFRDTGSTAAASLAAASWKFNVVHLAHLQDTTYPIAGVRAETDALTAAGYPLMRIEVDGGHYDAPDAIENGHAVPGTNADLATYLFPHLTPSWVAP